MNASSISLSPAPAGRHALRAPVVAAALLAVLGALACRDVGKASEEQAAQEAAALVSVVNDAVAQVRRGLPEGAKKLGTLIDADPGANLAGLQRAIQSSRASVKDLDVAKSTFFSFADPGGVVLRSESDPDAAANRSILASFPDLKKALDPSSGVVEAFGEMTELRGVRTGADAQWVAAHPVRNAGGVVQGMFVTGWSLRRFAYFLEETAKRHLVDAAEKQGKKTIPVVYVFAVKGAKAYGAPVTPDVNADAMTKLDAGAKTAQGPYRGVIEITGRTFGVAAERTPTLGDDAAVAVLISEL